MTSFFERSVSTSNFVGIKKPQGIQFEFLLGLGLALVYGLGVQYKLILEMEKSGSCARSKPDSFRVGYISKDIAGNLP
jgi:hypothetical protein